MVTQKNTTANITKNYIVQQVYDILKSRIIEDRFSMNEKISIVAISEELGVSRTPVATAMTMLRNDGYLNIIPQSGTFVRELTDEEIKMIFRYRAALEPISMEVACEKASKVILSQFREAFLAFNERTSFDLQALRDLYKVDVDFHSYIESLLPEIVRISITRIGDLTKRSRFLNLEFESRTQSTEYVKEKNIGAHVHIIDALINNDLETARDLALQDVVYTEKNVLQFLIHEGS